MPVTMNISLPEPLRHFVEEEVNAGGYSSTSDYMRALIRDRRKRAAEDNLRALIAEGLASGPAQPVAAANWAERRQRAGK